MQNKPLSGFILFWAWQHISCSTSWKYPSPLTFVTNIFLIFQHQFFPLFSGFVQKPFTVIDSLQLPPGKCVQDVSSYPCPTSRPMLLVIQQHESFTTLGTFPSIFQNVLTPWSDVIHRLSSVISLLGSLL